MDVTQEVLGLGIAGRNIADKNEATLANRWNKVPDNAGDTCVEEPNPNAIIRLQRIRDIPINLGTCGVTVVGGVVTAVSTNEHDYWENTLYDTREAQMRDATAIASTDINLAGVMHYVELDVNNLRRWLAGQLVAQGGVNGTNAKNDNGYIVYFSDRRGKNAGAPALQQGEFGFEDNVNPATAAGTPNGVLDVGEDANANGALEFVFGRTARNVPAGATTPCLVGYPNPLHAATFVTQVLTNASVGAGAAVGANCAGAGQVATATPLSVKALVARANRPLFFRRALKIVNGGLGNLPTSGLTIASENPVYVQGNYNANAADTLAIRTCQRQSSPTPSRCCPTTGATCAHSTPQPILLSARRRRPDIAWRSSAASPSCSRGRRRGRRRRTSAPTVARTISSAFSRGGAARRSTTAARS